MKIILGVIDDIDKSDELYHEKLKELTDFWLFNASLDLDKKEYDLEIKYFSSENELLKYSSVNKFDYCIGSWIGNLLKPGRTTIKHIIKDTIEICQNADGLVGHINLFEDKIPYLYKSYWCIDVNIYNELGSPNWETDDFENYPTFIRSDENIHHHYTPLWVKPGGSKNPLLKFQIKWGTGLTKSWLESGRTIINFPPSNRELRNHLYPEHSKELKLYFNSKFDSANFEQPSQKQYFYNIDYDLGKNKVFLFNTDQLDFKSTKVNLNNFVGVAAGFRPLLILHRSGFYEDTVVKYIDYSKIGLSFRKWLVQNWDGKNIEKATKDFEKHIGKEINWLKPFHLTYEQCYEQVISEFGGFTNWLNFWDEYRHLPHEYHEIDVMIDTDKIKNLLDPAGLNYLYISNCFNTEAGLVKWGKKKLKEKLNLLIRDMKDIPVIFDGSDADHHYPAPDWLNNVVTKLEL